MEKKAIIRKSKAKEKHETLQSSFVLLLFP
jgi:hypothetical protein